MQIHALAELGVAPERIYVDKGLTGTNRPRPGLDQGMAVMRKGHTLVVALGRTIHDTDDPMGKKFFNILTPFAEFEADPICLRTREGMAITRAKGKP